MNILLAISNIDGASWIAFNTDSFNLELEHHKNLLNAINSCLSKKEVGNTKHGDIISTCYDEMYEEEEFISIMLRGTAYFADEESKAYDPRYQDITIKPPFTIDHVLTVRTFG